MDRGMILFLGCMLTFTSSWLGLVAIPQMFMSKEQPATVDEISKTVYPRPLSSLEEQGRDIYKANGCIYCHSQYVRSEKLGNNSDILRGWGGNYSRRTVSRDYLYDRPIMLGTMRTGPDLANVATRWSDDWQHKHLYNPRMMIPDSIMPAFAFLYEKQKITGQPSKDALILSGEWVPEPGYEIVPTSDAKALIAYLRYLNKDADLPEAHDP
jgi:cytochrome c oxidase cbb3-type subunit II